jgi:DNA modification methylase
MIDKFINKVYHGNALNLLRALPPASIDAVITDAMYGTSKNFEYDWGVDPGRGDSKKHWRYHQPIYRECLRVLRPGGVMAWGQGAKFVPYFQEWFGDHRVWILGRSMETARPPIGNIWMVQTREQQAIEFPQRDSLVMCDREAYRPLRTMHPCPKPVEELEFMISSLTKPGQIVLDCFAGAGSTLAAAASLGRRWIGCDLSKRYCQITMKRMAERQKTAAPTGSG